MDGTDCHACGAFGSGVPRQAPDRRVVSANLPPGRHDTIRRPGGSVTTTPQAVDLSAQYPRARMSGDLGSRRTALGHDGNHGIYAPHLQPVVTGPPETGERHRATGQSPGRAPSAPAAFQLDTILPPPRTPRDTWGARLPHPQFPGVGGRLWSQSRKTLTALFRRRARNIHRFQYRAQGLRMD